MWDEDYEPNIWSFLLVSPYVIKDIQVFSRAEAFSDKIEFILTQKWAFFKDKLRSYKEKMRNDLE